MTDPTDDAAANEVGAATGLRVERLLVNDDDLDRAIRRAAEDVADQSKDEQPTLPMPKPQPPAQQSMSVVLGEPSSLDLRYQDAASEMFVDPVSIDNDFIREPSGVFTNRTIDMPMVRQPNRAPITSPPRIASQAVISVTPTPPVPPPAPFAAPPAPPQLIDDPTREVDLKDTAALMAGVDPFTDPTAAMGKLPVVQAQLSDDRTVPNDDLLFLMRVLIVAAEPRQSELRSVLAPRIKQLTCATLATATAIVEQRRFDEIVIVDPDNTVVGSQQLASVAARAKRDITVLSNNPDLGRLPGIRQTIRLSGIDSDLGRYLLGLLQRRAHGEG